MLELYHARISTRSQKVRLCLAGWSAMSEQARARNIAATPPRQRTRRSAITLE